MKVVLFFIAIAACIYGMFWYARNEGYISGLMREEDCPEEIPDIADEEGLYGYDDRLRDASRGCI